jgi:hypothetical protein
LLASKLFTISWRLAAACECPRRGREAKTFPVVNVSLAAPAEDVENIGAVTTGL